MAKDERPTRPTRARTKKGRLELADFMTTLRHQLDVPLTATFTFTVKIPANQQGNLVTIDDDAQAVRFEATYEEDD